MKCPNCGSDSNGAFCAQCGTPLAGAKCRECGTALAAGARYCTNCGTPAAGAARGARPNYLPWIAIGGGVLAVTALLLTRPRNTDTGEEGRVPLTQFEQAASAGGTEGTNPLSGTPREQADRLFNRIMTEKETGDTTQAKFFLPMALQAYDMAQPLDNDGWYHLSLLHSVGGDYKAAVSAAEQILSKEPNHLLALSAAGDASAAAKDNTTARSYYQRFLAAYDSESKLTKPEYQDHGRMLPELKAQAEAFVK